MCSAAPAALEFTAIAFYNWQKQKNYWDNCSIWEPACRALKNSNKIYSTVTLIFILVLCHFTLSKLIVLLKQLVAVGKTKLQFFI